MPLDEHIEALETELRQIRAHITTALDALEHIYTPDGYFTDGPGEPSTAYRVGTAMGYNKVVIATLDHWLGAE